ncbi:hypothetical protein FRB95_012720 [Tulasnella sp. JGI-2019a]|nr:hypothetical protein FRB95_012720 [Tulasnella sp. JGI-2019a]
MPSAAPYGTWKSPISADMIAKQTISVAEVHVDPITKTIYHSEARPSEAGRMVPVDTVALKDVFGKDWNACSGVHDYGGAAVTVHNGTIYFTDFNSWRLYVIKNKGDPEAVSPVNPEHRFGDFVVHPTQSHSHFLVSILEDHTDDTPSNVVNTLVAINTKTQVVTTIAKGADFYSTPRFSPNGKFLSFIRWNHSNMPWEASELVLAELKIADGDKVVMEELTVIAGKGGGVSITQSQWASDGVIVFLSDESGFYNPWKYDVQSKKANPILGKPADEDYAGPAWFLGMSDSSILDASTLLVAPSKTGLALLNINTGALVKVKSPFVTMHEICGISDRQAVLVGERNNNAPALIRLTLKSSASSYFNNASDVDADFETLKTTADAVSQVPPLLFPIPQEITLKAEPNDAPLYVTYFAPTNPEYSGGQGKELPPCVLHLHGGPTSQASSAFNWVTMYFTSRGWAWVNVNYGGSSGYGREYRDRLRGNWGLVDVNDSASSVTQLGTLGLIDSKRVAIRGGSAGGFTTLASLVNKPDTFATGASSYGICNLITLAEKTHKFESRYIDGLVGILPQDKKLYEERSPYFHAEKITAPLLVLHGVDDHVVPRDQADDIVKKIQDHGGKVTYKLFEGEGHGWRKEATIKEALETEEEYYKDVFGMKA